MTTNFWWQAPKGDVARCVFETVSEIERVQCDIFERFVKLAALYAPQDRWGARNDGPQAQVSENVIASNVDTVHAMISSQEVRARFMTDDADWGTQRRARHLEWYTDGLSKLLKVHEVAQRSFRDAALKGTGLVKVHTRHGRILVERVLVDDIVVDEGACRSAPPQQMYQRVFVNRGVLQARFPAHAQAIQNAQADNEQWRYWADYRPLQRDEVVVIESYHLPIPGSDEPGRYAICIDGHDLADEPWEQEHFPFARIVWSEPDTGWYGISLAQRIAGHQRTLNKLNWQIDRQLDQIAVPTTYVQMADANLAVKTTNRAGTIVPIKGDYPKTVIPPAVSGETYMRRDSVKESAFEESGVSRMAAQSRKPADIESGVALREWRDQSTQRFAPQEHSFEQHVLRILWLAIGEAKRLGNGAPSIVSRAKKGTNKLSWSQVDMNEVEVQISAASGVSRTPAGRTQTVLDWAQAGIVSQDEARRLLRHPDLQRAMSLYDAAMEDIERTIESLLDGESLFPEPYQNLKMGVWRVQQAYLKACDDHAPEEIKESLRQWLVQAVYMLNLAAQPPSPGGMAPESAPVAPGGAYPAPTEPGMVPVAQTQPVVM